MLSTDRLQMEATIVSSWDTTRMWANAQRHGRPAEYRWRPLLNAAKFGWRPLLVCHAVTLPRRESRWNWKRCSDVTYIVVILCFMCATLNKAAFADMSPTPCHSTQSRLSLICQPTPCHSSCHLHRRDVSRWSRWLRCCTSSFSTFLALRHASMWSFCRRRNRWLATHC